MCCRKLYNCQEWCGVGKVVPVIRNYNWRRVDELEAELNALTRLKMEMSGHSPAVLHPTKNPQLPMHKRPG